MTNPIQELLESIEDIYSKTSESAKVPEGIYYCLVTKMEPGETQKGDSKLVFHLKIQAGAYKGMMLFFHRTIQTDPTGLMFMKRDLINLGFPSDSKASEILTFQWAGLMSKVSVKMSGEYTNVTPLEPITSEDIGDDDSKEAAADEVPF